ncbi:PTS sugar transporter subunit IIABC [Mycoplasma sp. NEAQ87857]|uniref:PTS sugar transporter subunit IIABC n=1 Tax=Mycoplasma sp. NEAQ87857 TaxID=2683967 RepID=UPI001318E200|nr:PTS sugar transporter subunit IIABC [Mycoplasma sp. NEAQ87857]QGZ97513.1 PTS sugar transporter subunit IIABC [Mycoplasma sp. NEAQ87857]
MNKNNLKIVILTLLTFGLIWIKWNKKKHQPENTIYQNDKLPFKISLLLDALKPDNILEIDQKPSRVKIMVNQADIIDLDAIKKLKGIRGVFLKSDSITLVFGEYSQVIAKELSNYVK